MEPVTAETVRAAGALWKQSGRTITAAFGGASMEPSIRAGQPVTIRCGFDIAKGDVVLFFHCDRMIVHRVVALSATHVLTAGDAHVLPDPFVAERAAIVGRVEDVPPPRLRLAARAARLLSAAAFAVAPSLTLRVLRSLQYRLSSSSQPSAQ
jgi:hypothetical protein